MGKLLSLLVVPELGGGEEFADDERTQADVEILHRRGRHHSQAVAAETPCAFLGETAVGHPALHQKGKNTDKDDVSEGVAHQRPDPRAAPCQYHAERARQHRGREIAEHHLPKAHLPLHAGGLDGVKAAEQEGKRVKTHGSRETGAAVEVRQQRGRRLHDKEGRSREGKGDDKHREIIPLAYLRALDEGGVDAVFDHQHKKVDDRLQQHDLAEKLRGQQPRQQDLDHEADELGGKALGKFIDQGSDDFALFHVCPFSPVHHGQGAYRAR